jgi:hypothetical protein
VGFHDLILNQIFLGEQIKEDAIGGKHRIYENANKILAGQ